MSSQIPEPSESGISIAVRQWSFAVAVYFVAVLNRTSLGVAGLLAEHRFGIGPGQLSVFIFLQLGVYAAMQVPTGILVDRYGPRRLLVTAGLTMGVGQLLFALAPSYGLALLARALLGCGDALTYISVLRVAARYFSPKRYPLMATVSGMIGTVGNVVATLPMAVLLRSVGWAPVFLAACVLGAVSAAGAHLFLRDSNDGVAARSAIAGLGGLRDGVRSVLHRVRTAWSLPGTRMGFWLHFSTPSVNYAFSMLWGDPYLIKACGFSSSGAGAVLMAAVITASVVGPFLGWTIGMYPHTRSPIALVFGLLMLAGWGTAFGLGDHPSRDLIVPLFLVMAIGGMISMFAFAVARDYNHVKVLGTATGVVNAAGFLGAITIAVVMGLALDALGGTTAHALRWALLVPIVAQFLGTSQLFTWYRRLRAHVLAEQEAGHDVPVPAVRRRWDLTPD